MTNNDLTLTASRIIDIDLDDETIPSTREEIIALALDSIDALSTDDDELTDAILACDRDALANAIADELLAR